jgi:hypothetical protein
MATHKDYTALIARIDAFGEKLGFTLTDANIDMQNCTLKEDDANYWEAMMACALNAADSRLEDYESDYGIRTLLTA